MTAEVAPQPHAHAPTGEGYLTHERGLKSWLFTLDHKRIGLMYLGSVLLAFLLSMNALAIYLRNKFETRW
mgnify:CR=1 FL=1